MKGFLYALFFLSVVLCSSCVSKKKYSSLEYDYQSLKKENKEIEEQYRYLVDRFNSLQEDYYSLERRYGTLEFENLRNEHLIEFHYDILHSCHDALSKLQLDFSPWLYERAGGNSSKIEEDIKSIRDHLNGEGHMDLLKLE